MKLTICFSRCAMLLALGLMIPRMYCAEEQVDLGQQLLNRVINRDYQTAISLIEQGANTNASYKGMTTLMFAVRNGDSVELVHMLVKNKANVNADNDGETVLQTLVRSEASFANFKAIADMLIKAGARIDAKDKEGDTALHYAVRVEDSLNKVRYLLSKGADAGIADNNRKFAVDLVPEGNVALRNLLLDATHRPHIKKG